MRHLLACVLVSLIVLAGAFQSGEQKRKRKALRSAAAGIKLGEAQYSKESTMCAACEATARSIEDQMKLGKHKGDAVGRLSMLYAACEKVDANLPQEMEPVEPGGPKVLHFFAVNSAQAKKIGPVSVGLSEFCTTLVEEYEDELSDVMHEAVATTGSGPFRGLYEMKVAVCVKTANACTDEQLNTITQHRIGQASKMDPARLKELSAMMAQMGGKDEM